MMHYNLAKYANFINNTINNNVVLYFNTLLINVIRITMRITLIIITINYLLLITIIALIIF